MVTVTTSVSQLADVVQRLTAGASSMDPEERAALRTSWAMDRDRRRHVRDQLESLSPQQRRVLELLASGRRVAEVGVEMGVAEGTVRSHVKALRAKLGASHAARRRWRCSTRPTTPREAATSCPGLEGPVRTRATTRVIKPAGTGAARRWAPAVDRLAP